jgi:hypothetical protein
VAVLPLPACGRYELVPELLPALEALVMTQLGRDLTDEQWEQIAYQYNAVNHVCARTGLRPGTDVRWHEQGHMVATLPDGGREVSELTAARLIRAIEEARKA